MKYFGDTEVLPRSNGCSSSSSFASCDVVTIRAVNLAKRQAIARGLVAIEELGVGVLCSDKTGTLTENKLTAGEPITFDFSNSEVFLLAAPASEGGDAIDDAILEKVDRAKISNEYRVKEFIPWDPVRKSYAVVEKYGIVFRVTKGAPQVIASMAGVKLSSYVDELAGGI